jgi:hypothetical protein
MHAQEQVVGVEVNRRLVSQSFNLGDLELRHNRGNRAFGKLIPAVRTHRSNPLRNDHGEAGRKVNIASADAPALLLAPIIAAGIDGQHGRKL